MVRCFPHWIPLLVATAPFVTGASGAARSDEAPESPTSSTIQLVANVTDDTDEPAPPRPLDLESMLKRWQAEVSRIQNAEVTFHRYVYDHVYRAETRGTGRLCFEAPNLGSYGVEPATDVRPARTDSRGENYTLQADSRSVWQWDSSSVWFINRDLKLYDVIRIRKTPAEVNGIAWNYLSDLNSPARVVPGVVDASDDFLNRFQWKLVREDDRGLLLEGTPKHNRDCAELRLLQVRIDAGSYRTNATRAVNATRTKETVHIFQYVSVNNDRVSRQSWVPDVTGLTNSSAYQSSNVEVEE